MMNGSYMMRFISQQQDGNSLTSCHSGNGLYGIGNGGGSGNNYSTGSGNSGSGGNGYNCSNTPSNGSNASGGSINGGALNYITNGINGKDILPSSKPTALL